MPIESSVSASTPSTSRVLPMGKKCSSARSVISRLLHLHWAGEWVSCRSPFDASGLESSECTERQPRNRMLRHGRSSHPKAGPGGFRKRRQCRRKPDTPLPPYRCIGRSCCTSALAHVVLVIIGAVEGRYLANKATNQSPCPRGVDSHLLL